MNRESLAVKIAETSILHGDFTLRSGRQSSWYIDKYLFTTQPEILLSLGKLFVKRFPPSTTLLAGAELGGIPLVATASMASNIPCIFVRDQKKKYGTSKQIEGKLTSSDHVVIIEDVATTGGQVLEVAAIIQDSGAKVVSIISVIDRCEGARENIESAGYKFESLFTAADLGISETSAP